MIEQRANASPGIVALRAGLAWTLCWLDRRPEVAVILKQAASDRWLGDDAPASPAIRPSLVAFQGSGVRQFDCLSRDRRKYPGPTVSGTAGGGVSIAGWPDGWARPTA